VIRNKFLSHVKYSGALNADELFESLLESCESAVSDHSTLKFFIMKIPDAKSLTLIGAGLLLPMLAARGSRFLVGKSYTLLTDEEVPRNPAHPETAWREALIWAAVSGLVGGIATLTVRRLLAETMIPAEGDDMDHEIDKLA